MQGHVGHERLFTAKGQITFVASVFAFQTCPMCPGQVVAQIGLNTKQFATFFTRNRWLHIRIVSTRGMKFHLAFATKPFAAFGTDKVSLLGMSHAMNFQFTFEPKGLATAFMRTMKGLWHVRVHSGHVHFEHEVSGVEAAADFAIVSSLVIFSRMVFVPL